MGITKQELRELIKESIGDVVNEQDPTSEARRKPSDTSDYTNEEIVGELKSLRTANLYAVMRIEKLEASVKELFQKTMKFD